jgi:DNA-binding response OmpR family regulator
MRPTQRVISRLAGERMVNLPVVRFGELEIDILHRRARVESRDVHLTALELGLLYLLAVNGGRALTRDEILDHLWGGDFAAGSNVVDRHVHNLRAKLRDDWRRPRFIATVPGQGYCFVLAAADGVSAAPPSRAPPRGAASRAPGSHRSRRRGNGMTETS